jgi:5'-3' exonuclease
MKKRSILIDGAYFLYKTLFISQEFNSKETQLDSKKSVEQFVRKVFIDISAILRSLPSHQRIVFTSESKSWRKSILISGDGYKSNREDIKSSMVNWDNFYNATNEIIDILSNNGVVHSKINNAEGDDLLYLWANQLLKEGDDVIILTGDKDLYQCVKYNNDNEIYLLNPNSKNRILAIEDVIRNLSEKNDIYNGLFDEYVGINSTFEDLNKICKEVVKIDIEKFVLCKIAEGDKGDNVHSIFEWQKNGSTFKFTANKMLKILEKYPHTNINNLESNVDIIAKEVLELTKQKGDIEKIKENILLNKKVLYLDTSTIPNEIQTQFLDHYLETKDKRINFKNMNMKDILQDTKYIDKNKGIQIDLFKDLD